MKEEFNQFITLSNMCICSLGGPSVSVFNILCLQCWVAYGETHEYGAGSLVAQLLILHSAHKHAK